MDVRARAAQDAAALLTPDDLFGWEQRHGRIPEGAIVALCRGWDALVGDAERFLGRGSDKKIHLPGFHPEAVQYLQKERSVVGIVTDTYNLAAAQAHGFPVHRYWLGHGKWCEENVANLGLIPSGGPSRVLALL